MKTNPGESHLDRFLKLEIAGGVILFLAAVLAMLVANSILEPFYQSLLATPVKVQVGVLKVAKPLILWINDGLMAIFFFLVGLELKRELLEGELSNKKNVILPGIGAIGGMIAPATIYYMFNHHDPIAVRGWAIPAATDIAFALGVITLLGSRVPIALKVFLTSLAIFDDIGAIIIIALFYTSKISIPALIVVASLLPLLFAMNKSNVTSRSPYVFIGVIIWVATLKSGIHATLAGVLLAFFIPMKSNKQPEYSPLKSLEHSLHPIVAFIVLPIFAFANAGINLSGMTMDHLLHSVPLGIAFGLIFGKQIGIFGFCWLAIKLRWSLLPRGMNWQMLYATSAICGIGFTMSLFIGSLSFDKSSALAFDERTGIIIGSLVSGIVGYFLLAKSLNSASNKVDIQPSGSSNNLPEAST